MTFLKPDKIRTETIGGSKITIKEKIIADGTRASKYICSYVKKGDLVKPNKKLNDGSGRVKGITIHNTPDIVVAKGTNAAEQYARAMINGNMNGVAVHYWVWKTEIWQQLRDDERGWHASDGSRRRKDHRGGQTGGNVDTIAIECIGDDSVTEDTGAKLIAVLCKKHNLDPAYDVYSHNWWMHGVDKVVQGAKKNCPLYILNRWGSFISNVQGLYKQEEQVSDSLYRVQAGAFAKKANADALVKELKAKGFDAYVTNTL